MISTLAAFAPFFLILVLLALVVQTQFLLRQSWGREKRLQATVQDALHTASQNLETAKAWQEVAGKLEKAATDWQANYQTLLSAYNGLLDTNATLQGLADDHLGRPATRKPS
jgi:hypothetical protein